MKSETILLERHKSENIKYNEISTVAMIGIFILPAVQSQFSPKTNVTP